MKQSKYHRDIPNDTQISPEEIQRVVKEIRLLNELREYFQDYPNKFGGLPSENRLREMAKERDEELYDVLQKIKDWKDGE